MEQGFLEVRASNSVKLRGVRRIMEVAICVLILDSSERYRCVHRCDVLHGPQVRISSNYHVPIVPQEALPQRLVL